MTQPLTPPPRSWWIRALDHLNALGRPHSKAAHRLRCWDAPPDDDDPAAYPTCESCGDTIGPYLDQQGNPACLDCLAAER